MALELRVVRIKHAKRPGYINKDGGTKGKMGLFNSKQLFVFSPVWKSNHLLQTKFEINFAFDGC